MGWSWERFRRCTINVAFGFHRGPAFQSVNNIDMCPPRVVAKVSQRLRARPRCRSRLQQRYFLRAPGLRLFQTGAQRCVSYETRQRFGFRIFLLPGYFGSTACAGRPAPFEQQQGLPRRPNPFFNKKNSHGATLAAYNFFFRRRPVCFATHPPCCYRAV